MIPMENMIKQVWDTLRTYEENRTCIHFWIGDWWNACKRFPKEDIDKFLDEMTDEVLGDEPLHEEDKDLWTREGLERCGKVAAMVSPEQRNIKVVWEDYVALLE